MVSQKALVTFSLHSKLRLANKPDRYKSKGLSAYTETFPFIQLVHRPVRFLLHEVHHFILVMSLIVGDQQFTELRYIAFGDH